MKRANNLLPRIADMDSLRLAYWKAGKGKRYAVEVLAYQADLETNLRELQQQIRTGSVTVFRIPSISTSREATAKK